jgi:hypothetical protein
MGIKEENQLPENPSFVLSLSSLLTPSPPVSSEGTEYRIEKMTGACNCDPLELMIETISACETAAARLGKVWSNKGGPTHAGGSCFYHGNYDTLSNYDELELEHRALDDDLLAASYKLVAVLSGLLFASLVVGFCSSAVSFPRISAEIQVKTLLYVLLRPAPPPPDPFWNGGSKIALSWNDDDASYNPTSFHGDITSGPKTAPTTLGGDPILDALNYDDQHHISDTINAYQREVRKMGRGGEGGRERERKRPAC